MSGIAAAALLVAGAAGPIAAAQDSTPTGPVASPPVSRTQAARVETYWTEERMKAAKPLDVAPSEALARAQTGKTAAPVTRGKPAKVRPAGGGTYTDSLPSPTTDHWEANPFPRAYTTRNERTNVKVFFEQAGGNYVCSGTLVNSRLKNMVSTAGHCVSDGAGTWSTNVLVVPGYSSECDGCGDTPYGVWSAYRLTTLSEWHYNWNLLQDIGYINLYPDENGQNAIDVLGGRGTVWNRTRKRVFSPMGYPQAAPYNGYSQYRCRSNRLRNDDPFFGGLPGPKTMEVWCDLTGGASGGSWMTRLRDGVSYQNSLNSYRYTHEPRKMYGPYFGEAARELFKATAQGL